MKNLPDDGAKGKWLKFWNTDFSAYIRTQPRHNSKNHVVYAKQKSDVRSLLSNKEQKFSPGVMLWGGICARGLVPPSAPLFVDQVLAPWSKGGAPVKNVNNIVYADMLECLVHPGVMKLYPAGDCLWQDDEAKIHRTDHVLAKVDELFKHRIPPKMASHTADLYPIENLWSILKDEVSRKAPIKDVKQLKNIIRKKWREVHADKDLCKRMIASVQAMVRLKGVQVHKSDYEAKNGSGDS